MKPKKATAEPKSAAKIAPKATKSLKALKPKAPVCSAETEQCPAEANLKRFIKTPLAMTFVKKKNGAWDHQDWLVFIEEIKQKGYDPIDTDKVGLILEEKKVQFLSIKKG